MTLQHIFPTDLPIVQAPMAGVQGAALAAAVCNAGALGSLPCAMLSPQQLQQELDLLRQLTDKPFNLNFFCHPAPVPDAQQEARWRQALRGYYDAYGIDPASIAAEPLRTPFTHASADILEALPPAVVSFHFGLPSSELLERVKSWGSIVLSCATTVAEAVWLQDRGVDAIIAQGLEAGGHRGMFLSTDLTTQMGTFALVRQMVQAVRLPVIAAGGIADAQGVRAALALGASAVQIGTAYLLCHEATTGPLHRAALQAPDVHTALTNLFTGRPARGIVNRLMRELGPLSELPPSFPLAGNALLPLRTQAQAQQCADFSALWSGQNTSGCQTIGAAELTRQLAVGVQA